MLIKKPDSSKKEEDNGLQMVPEQEDANDKNDDSDLSEDEPMLEEEEIVIPKDEND